MIETETLLGRKYFCLNSQDNGGETVSFTTTVWNNGGSRHIKQEFYLSSYCNGAYITLQGEIITPTQLRLLANELDQKLAQLSVLEPFQVKGGYLSTHRFVFQSSPAEDNSPSLSLTTHINDNGDGPRDGIFIDQHLTLQSCGNTATFHLSGAAMDTATIRRLANELDTFFAMLPE